MKEKRWRSAVVVLALITALLGGCAAESSDSAAAQKFAGTVFCEYLWGLNAQEQTLDLVFFCGASEMEKWTLDNIEEVILHVGNDSLLASVTSLQVEDTLLYDSCYRGTLALCADFSMLSGKSANASAEVWFCDAEEAEAYDLGNIGILPEATEEDAVIGQLVMCGIVREDENENVMTYGVIVHLDASEEIVIHSMSFGLDEVMPLPSGAIAYSYEEYQSTVYGALEESTLDELIADAYIRATAEDETQCSLMLEEGETYLYIPVGYTADTDAALIQAALVIDYTTADGDGTYITSSVPFFSELGKSEEALEEMFSR